VLHLREYSVLSINTGVLLAVVVGVALGMLIGGLLFVVLLLKNE